MRKLLFELFVRMVTGSEGKTERIMQIAYGEPMVGIKDAGFDKCENGHFFKVKDGGCNYCPSTKKTNVGSVVVNKPKLKKDELLENLSYLKNKPNKTKQDSESIYTIEMVLKNMK